MFTKSKLWAVGLLAAVGVAGFASGAATVSWAGDRRCTGRERFSYSGMLQEELRLSGAQRDSVRAILRRHRPEMRAISETVRPRLDSVRAVIHAEIRGVLTAEQYAGFEGLLARERAERLRRDSAETVRGGGR